jgi:hypothetical protein
MTRTELIKQAIESAKCRIYKLNFDTNKELSAHHQRKAENQKELMEITVEALERMLDNNSEFGKWIPCSERLPQESGYYLATIYGATTSTELEFDSTYEQWWGNSERYHVLAWMPLPSAYKGE